MGIEITRAQVPTRALLLERWFVVALVVTALGGALALQAARYFPFFSDDAFISLRYAKRFAEGHGLTWTGAERVEGYTDFLWVVLLGTAGRLGVDYMVGARVFGFLGVLGCALSLGFSPTTGRWTASRLLLAAPLMVLSTPLVVWAIGGLEHGFMAGILGLAFVLVSKRALISERVDNADFIAGIPLAALSLLRADGVVLSAAILFGAFLTMTAKVRSVWRTLVMSVPTALAVASQLAFRLVYYRAAQPNTALAKLAFNRARLFLGIDYLRTGYSAVVVLVILALLSTASLSTLKKGREVIIPWTLVITWSLYQVAVGGDIFPAYRQLVFPIVGFAAVVAIWTEHARSKSWQRLLVGAALIPHFLIQQRAPENARAAAEMWEWDGFPIASALSSAFGAREPLLAVDAAGALPYWSGFPCLDMLGLTDRYIAEHPPSNFGSGPIGHELGDGAYVWSRKPDLIAFDNAAGKRDPIFLSGRQLLAMPEFNRDYQWIKIQGTVGNRSYGLVWVRREGGKAGISRTDDRISVPGYLFTGQASEASASIDSTGKLVALVSREKPGEIVPFSIGPGRFRMHLVASDTRLATSVRCGDAAMSRVGAGPTKVLEFDRPTLLTVSVAPREESVSLESVEFEKAEGLPTTFRCTPPGAPLTLAPSDLSEPKREGTYWLQPGNFSFGQAGLSVKLDEVSHARSIELSVDNDDTYAIEALLRGKPIPFAESITPKTSIPGLAIHTLAVSPADAPHGFDEVRLVPRSGDGRFVVGHLTFQP